jgi:hypothetical protein
MDAIRAAVGDRSVVDVVAVLLPEPNNPHGRNAVGVYVAGAKVGHIPSGTSRTMGHVAYDAIARHGVCAVAAQISVGGDWGSVVLEPALQGSLNRANLTMILDQAGFRSRQGPDDGFTMRQEENRFKVFWSGSDQDGREENVPDMAAALRKAGFKARVAREGGYPYVSVTAEDGEIAPKAPGGPSHAR